MKHRLYLSAGLALVVVFSQVPAPRAQQPTSSIAVRTRDVGGVKLQDFAAGQGPAIVLLHGYAETSRMWRPLIPRLAEHHMVIAPDLPGIGDSDVPADGLDMTRAAVRIHDLIKDVGYRKGRDRRSRHRTDGGLRVCRAVSCGDREARADGCVSAGVRDWKAIYGHPAKWHFRFNGPTPEALVAGRERAYFEHYLERLRRRQDAIHSRGRSPVLRGGVRASGPDARRVGDSSRFQRPRQISRGRRRRS